MRTLSGILSSILLVFLVSACSGSGGGSSGGSGTGGGAAHSGTKGTQAPVAPVTLAAKVASVLPSVGPLMGGSKITITGTYFAAGSQVLVDTLPCLSVNVVSSSQITCVTPGHVAGKVDVSVLSPEGKTSRLPLAFRYVGQADPMPGFGSVASGGVSTGGGMRLRLSVEGAGSPIPMTGAGIGAKTGLQGAIAR